VADSNKQLNLPQGAWKVFHEMLLRRIEEDALFCSFLVFEAAASVR
jgi:hypothetical protein